MNSRPRRLLAALAVATVAGAPVALGQTSEGRSFLSFEAIASGDGIRVTFVATNTTAVDELVDIGAPMSQASLDSLGNALAIAALPFPGSVANENAGLIASLAGLPPPPDNPAVVQSNPSNPEMVVDQPGYSLSAKSTATSAEGRAASGHADESAAVASSTTRALAELVDDNNTLRATGSSVTEAFRVADSLTISGVRSSATASRSTRSDQLERTQSLSVDSIDVGGQQLGITDEGLVVLGQVVPIPLESVLDPLAEQGIGVRVLDPVEFEDGILSAALEVTVAGALPDPSLPSGTLTYVFGRSMARVGARVSSPTPPVFDSSPAPPAPLSSSGAAPATQPPPQVLGETLATTEPAPAPSSFQELSPDVAESSAPSAAPVPSPAPVGTPSVVLSSPSSLSSMYLIIVLGAIFGVGTLQLVRQMGVRLRWNS